MLDFLDKKFDLNRRAIETWKQFSEVEKQNLKEYFDLKDLTDKLYTEYAPFQHTFTYRLSDDDVLRIVFCAVVEIIRYNIAHNMKRIFIGNSGGLDSATTCGLLARVVTLSKDLGVGCEVISYGLPIESNPEHNDRAKETADQFKLRHITVHNLDTVFVELKKTLLPLAQEFFFSEDEVKRGLGNAKARLRMIVNFFGTTSGNSYVISTDNLSELYMAFWTLMGDVGAFGPIQNIFKGIELPTVAYALGVPDRTLGAKPTDGLGVHTSLDNQEGGDTDAFKGVSYPLLDVLICYAVKNGLRLDSTQKVALNVSEIPTLQNIPQETADYLIKQMASPASVWKRTKGSIGSAISREELGLKPITELVHYL
jgi:NAD+ synthetase